MSLLSRQAEKLCSRLDLARLAPRLRGDLAFVEEAAPAGVSLLLDTGTYIHQLKSKTPSAFDALVGARLVNHSVVAVQEMLHAIGILDPTDPRTKANVAAIRALLENIPPHRLFVPARDVMCDAAVYAGVLCRLQGFAKDQRMKALHDCTLFFQARKLGSALVTADVSDFDLLQQLQPESQVLYYKAL